jgi:hypothetical protein
MTQKFILEFLLYVAKYDYNFIPIILNILKTF